MLSLASMEERDLQAAGCWLDEASALAAEGGAGVHRAEIGLYRGLLCLLSSRPEDASSFLAEAAAASSDAGDFVGLSQSESLRALAVTDEQRRISLERARRAAGTSVRARDLLAVVEASLEGRQPERVPQDAIVRVTGSL
ncbi:MAG TPA: hypothetical protein QGF58_07815 [Myxococcota bacterium]|nr:hypothetical protein [Myxococcota bacterium]